MYFIKPYQNSNTELNSAIQKEVACECFHEYVLPTVYRHGFALKYVQRAGKLVELVKYTCNDFTELALGRPACCSVCNQLLFWTRWTAQSVKFYRFEKGRNCSKQVSYRFSLSAPLPWSTFRRRRSILRHTPRSPPGSGWPYFGKPLTPPPPPPRRYSVIQREGGGWGGALTGSNVPLTYDTRFKN